MKLSDFKINQVYVDNDPKYPNDTIYIYKGITMTGIMVFESYFNNTKSYTVFHESDFNEEDGSFLCATGRDYYYFVPLMDFFNNILKLSLPGLIHSNNSK